MKLKAIPAPLLAAFAFVVAVAMAVAPARGAEIFVVSAGPEGPNDDGSVGAYDATTGATVNASLITGLLDPIPIAMYDGNLLVTGANRTIGEYTTDGAVVNASLFTIPSAAFGMAVVGDDLYFAGPGGLTEYTAAGLFVSDFRLPALDFGDSLSAIAASGTDLFVTNYNSTSYSVGEFTTSGATVNASLITGLQNPNVIAVSGSDLFVGYGTTIGEYTTSGATVNASLITGLPGEGVGLAVSGGDLFVAYTGNGPAGTDVIGEYTTSGVLVNASFITGLDVPTGILITPEPSTWVMFAIGAAALIVSGFRKRRLQV